VSEILERLEAISRTLADTPDPRPEWLREAEDEAPGDALYYRFLYQLAAECAPGNMLEIGTRNGASAVQLAAGNPRGRVITVDIMDFAGEKVSEFGCENLRFVKGHSLKVIGAVRDEMPSIDLLYIDAMHNCEPAAAEYLVYGALLAPEGVVLFDDIHINYGMNLLWESLRAPKVELNHLHRTCGAGFGAALGPGAGGGPK
jgi:predicted O-methyltransferase YrrM